MTAIRSGQLWIEASDNLDNGSAKRPDGRGSIYVVISQSMRYPTNWFVMRNNKIEEWGGYMILADELLSDCPGDTE